MTVTQDRIPPMIPQTLPPNPVQIVTPTPLSPGETNFSDQIKLKLVI